MSASRSTKRQPKTLTEFANHLANDEAWALRVWATIQDVAHKQAIIGEHKRRQAWPRWRKWLHQIRLAVK